MDAAAVLALLALLCLLAASTSATPQALPSMPRVEFQDVDGGHVVRLGPIPEPQLNALRLAGLEGAANVLAVHILEDGDRAMARQRPAVLGTRRIEGSYLLFEPRFPWMRGQAYLARWRPPTTAAQSMHEEVLTLPSSPAHSAVTASKATLVQEIYPSTPEVPQNLLKIYLQFSGPMTRGVAHHHLTLWREADSEDEADARIDSPFVAPEHELWNPAGDRLTLLFDPGRLKRGVGPNAAIGPPLQSGQRIRLDVDAAWPDASGRPLGHSAQRRWQVQDSDRSVPRPQSWKVIPPAHFEAPLTVIFDEPLDVALLQHALTVHRADDTPLDDALDGDVVVDSEEQRWRFTPRQPWTDLCNLVLHVHPVLEDLAGNRTFRRFDEPIPTAPQQSAKTDGEGHLSERSQRPQNPESSVDPVVLAVPCADLSSP